MATKINIIQGLTKPDSVMTAKWLEQHNISRTEQSKYVKSGWLTRMATGVYRFTNFEPTLFHALAAYETQLGLTYRVAASTALELFGYMHYIPMGKVPAHIATSLGHQLPEWFATYNWDRILHEFTTKVFDGSIGVTTKEYEGVTLRVSTPELAIMECLLLSTRNYNLTDVYHLMECLTSLRPKLVSDLLEHCTSVKVKRLFLYMAEKAGYQWFNRLDLSNVTLGSGPRSFAKGGVKIPKYNIVVPYDLATYE